MTVIQPKLAETRFGCATGSEVERVYRRTDFLEQRRALMDLWGSQALTNSSEILRRSIQ